MRLSWLLVCGQLLLAPFQMSATLLIPAVYPFQPPTMTVRVLPDEGTSATNAFNTALFLNNVLAIEILTKAALAPSDFTSEDKAFVVAQLNSALDFLTHKPLDPDPPGALATAVEAVKSSLLAEPFSASDLKAKTDVAVTQLWIWGLSFPSPGGNVIPVVPPNATVLNGYLWTFYWYNYAYLQIGFGYMTPQAFFEAFGSTFITGLENIEGSPNFAQYSYMYENLVIAVNGIATDVSQGILTTPRLMSYLPYLRQSFLVITPAPN